MAPLRGDGPVVLTPAQYAQRFVDSPGARRPARPLGGPRAAADPAHRDGLGSRMANRLHVIGGYAEQRVNNNFHQSTTPRPTVGREGAAAARREPCRRRSRMRADLRLRRLQHQNRNADDLAFAYDVAADRWDRIAPMPRARGAGALAVVDGKVHHIGGASNPEAERASVGWHEVYDPQTDRWDRRKALPGARDHAGVVVHNGLIHIVGGRFNTFEYNTGLHHVYDAAADQWTTRAPLPTARSGHGLVVYRGRFFAMGGERAAGSATAC
jgi:hypothetical protein